MRLMTISNFTILQFCNFTKITFTKIHDISFKIFQIVFTLFLNYCEKKYNNKDEGSF